MEEKIFNECLERMEILKLSKQCISAFKSGAIWESEGIGALYEVNEEEKAIITEFEREHEGYKVYHVIHNLTDFGELYNIFYVSTDIEEWELDKTDLKENYAFVYVYNKTDEFCSEFGSIAIRKNIGGLVRIG
nr:MAG TPA: hypothetical protein [Caudoviricetes sp.]